MITMVLLSMFLFLSARVVSQYFSAYQAMEKALPATKGLAHQLEFLTRQLSCAESIESPGRSTLSVGFRPSWDQAGVPLRLVGSDRRGQRIHFALGYSASDRGLVLVTHQETEGKAAVESQKLVLGASDGLWIKTTDIGRQSLLTLRLDPLGAGSEPLQTAISLRGVEVTP
jgi:hypothetical protein